MGKIFYLFGKSASGKDSIYERLLRIEDLGLHRVVLYTTRPIRTNEHEGVEYHFIDEEQLKCLHEEGRVIEERAYQTVHGVWKYLTVKDREFDPEQGDFLMVGTLESFVSIRDFFGESVVVPLYVFVEDGLRLQRALERERRQENPKFAEMCRRFLADEEDFAPDKLEAEGIRDGFENLDLEDTTRRIAERIRECR